MKRIPMLAVFLLALSIVSVVPAQQIAGTGATATPDHIVLSLTDDPATTQTVTWRTDTTVASGFVQYRSDAGQSKTVAATCSDFESNTGTVRIFTAALSKLSPNTKYTYSVGDGTTWSEAHAFSTAEAKCSAFKFLLFGDSQSAVPYNPWKTTVHNACDANRDARLMLMTGDIVDSGFSWDHWNAWFDAARGVIDSIPLMPAHGNHEIYKPGSKPYYWIRQFTLPQNGPDSLKGQAYSFDYGPVHFIVLDSQGDEEGPQILEAQKAWLDADLAASKATWKIALFHKPPYPVYTIRPNKKVKAAFCPVFDKYHVDMVFNGHDHCVARTYTIAGDSIVKKPSQGTVYYMLGRSGGKRYKPSEVNKDDAWDAFFLNPQSQPNYVVVDVTKTSLTVKAFNQDGTIIDTFFIDKASDINSYTQQGAKRDLPAIFKVSYGRGPCTVARIKSTCR